MNELYLKTRREFLRTSALGAAVSWTVPAFLSQTFNALHAEAATQVQPTTGKDSTILVVLQLAGGNDGLNTVVPFANDHYHKARPSLGLKANLHKLNDEFALHPSLSAFKELHDAGNLAIVHGVGYPNPNRSHFRSTEIWHTASDSGRFEKYGWLGRYFDNACKGSDPTIGLSVGRQTPQAFTGPRPLGISLQNPETYRMTGSDTPDMDETAGSQDFMTRLNGAEGLGADANSGVTIDSVAGPVQSQLSPLDYLERTALDAQISSERILKVSRLAKNQVSYPASQIANSFKLISRLIAGGLSTRVYYISQGGYDTHTNQAGAHERLLRDFSTALKAFMDDLKAQGNAGRVLVMTFSEFGRRVSQNANGGTDHGAAAPLFLVGPKLKSGLLGQYPSL
ncbi:MAG TPA: DUF1501 domain-containing protein, partial [Candidatus Kapabacteria bacterium]|nr:DUF1501 domain-containing protein [Candidatus Kapabacteria bacterium]